MTPRANTGAFVLVGALLVAACSGGSGDADPPIVAATSSTEPASSEPAPTTEPGPTTAPPTTAPPTEQLPTTAPVTYDELAARVIDGEVDELTLVLSEFAALFGVDVPGAVPLRVDSSLPTLGTDVLQAVRRLDARLTEEQRSIIEASIDEVVGGEVVYDTNDDDEYQALFETATGDVATADVATGAEPQGFGSARPRDVDELLVRSVAAGAAVALALELGGTPLVASVSVAPPEAADRGTVEALTEFYDIAGVRTCTITVYDRERNRGGHLASVIGHEVFHCWQHANASSSTAADAFAGFYKEGMATWVGEQFAADLGYASGSDFGWVHLENFLAPTYYDVYRAKYTAYGFWSQVAELRGGPDGLWSVIPALNAVGTDASAVFGLALEGVDEPRRAELAASAARQPDWSPAWNFTALGIPAVQRPVQVVRIRPGTPDERAVAAGEQAIVSFDLSGLDAGTNWVITRSNTGLTYNRLGDFDQYPTTVSEQSRYCYGETCACPDGSSPFTDLIVLPRTVTTLTTALTGSAVVGATVTVEAVDADGECDEEPAPVTLPPATFDGNGIWRATNPSLATMFADASAFGFGAVPLDIAAVSGDVVMELSEDGKGILTYTDVSVLINDGPVPDLTIDGTGNFEFGVDAGTLTVSGNTFTVGVSSSALEGEVLVITDRDIEGGAGGTATYTVGFDGNQLVLTGADGERGAVFFPTVWTRE